MHWDRNGSTSGCFRIELAPVPCGSYTTKDIGGFGHSIDMWAAAEAGNIGITVCDMFDVAGLSV
jgi:hypothetical protein